MWPQSATDGQGPANDMAVRISSFSEITKEREKRLRNLDRE